jgi:hypothetical protein
VTPVVSEGLATPITVPAVVTPFRFLGCGYAALYCKRLESCVLEILERDLGGNRPFRPFPLAYAWGWYAFGCGYAALGLSVFIRG